MYWKHQGISINLPHNHNYSSYLIIYLNIPSIRYISNAPAPSSDDNLESDYVAVLDYEPDNETVNIWEDDSPALKLTPNNSNSNEMKIGNLNKLVEVCNLSSNALDILLIYLLFIYMQALTSEEVIDNTFMKTFITTYQSFTTPSALLEKLIQVNR